MAKFRCKRCNYQFKSELDRIPRACPNCGEKESVKKEPSADELLNDNSWE